MACACDLNSEKYNAVPALKDFEFVADLKYEQQVKQWYH